MKQRESKGGRICEFYTDFIVCYSFERKGEGEKERTRDKE